MQREIDDSITGPDEGMLAALEYLSLAAGVPFDLGVTTSAVLRAEQQRPSWLNRARPC